MHESLGNLDEPPAMRGKLTAKSRHVHAPKEKATAVTGRRACLEMCCKPFHIAHWLASTLGPRFSSMMGTAGAQWTPALRIASGRHEPLAGTSAA